MSAIGSRFQGIVLITAFVSLGAACDDSSSESPPSSPATEKHEREPEPTPEPAVEPQPQPEKAEPRAELVSVSEDGTKFDPPVAAVNIPDGAWMCDMGTVHYASLEEGNGKCPICGMALQNKGSAGNGAKAADDGASSHSDHQSH